MHARHSNLQVSPDKIDDMLAKLRDEQLPKFREDEGYKGFTVHADRSSGRVVGITYWESEEAMKASEESANEARREAAETGGASAEPEVSRFEVLLDDMA